MNIIHFRIYMSFLALGASYACSAQGNAEDTINIRQLIDSLQAQLNKHYVFPEKAKDVSIHLYAQLQKKAYTPYLTNLPKLAAQIEKDIKQIHNDPHLEIGYDPNFVPAVNNKPTEQETKQAKKFWKEQNYSFRKVEILPGNIGYFPFNGFADDVEGAKVTIYSALRFLANTQAIIIDLRENHGGSPEMVSQIESYFFKEKTHMNDIINRGASDTAIFYADPAKADSLNLAMPVYILTSNNTFSAAEDFSYGMQQAKRATIVGEITGGGAHPQMPFPIGQGFVASIPFARSYNPVTKTDWEGTGVIPDVKVSAEEAFIKAQELFFATQILAVNDDKEKHRYEYYLRSLIPTKETSKLPLKLLTPYAGTYPDVTIYVDKNKLLCRNNHNNRVSELRHIRNNQFAIDENAQIEFFKVNSGRYTVIKIYLNDGSVFEELNKQ